MTNPTDKAKAVIEKLWQCSWPSECSVKGEHTCCGHPILIGDVLEKLKYWTFEVFPKLEYEDPTAEGVFEETEELWDYNFRNLIEKWQPCGFTRSLQEIAEDICSCREETNLYPDDACCEKTCQIEATALFDFLYEILT